jgi:hypothetical protein
LQKVVDRTAAACQVSRKTVIKVRKCDDIENWGVEDDHSDTMELTMNSRFSTPVSINTLRFRLNKKKKKICYKVVTLPDFCKHSSKLHR